MGADIHMVLERKYNDKWVGVHAFPYIDREISEAAAAVLKAANVYVPGWVSYTARGRNYELFAALAGVRGDGPEPLGVPEDASDLAAMEIEHWGGDGHSHSYMGLADAFPIFVAHLYPQKVLDDDRYLLREKLFGVDYDDCSEHRLVFWFDN